MRPGEQQPGGGPNPQWSNPYQQPGYPQQPGPPAPGHPAPGQPQQTPTQPAPQQPAQPYGQPYGTPTPGAPPQQPYQQPPSSGQWQQPGQFGAPPPDGGGKRTKTAVAIVVATAVVAAAVITGVFLIGGDDGDKDKKTNAGGTDPSPSAEESPGGGGEEQSTGGGGDPDDPRQGVLEAPDPVVAPDWQVQTIENRHNAFDVPPNWTLGAEDYMVGYQDDRENSDTYGEPLVMMSAVSTYMDGWCDDAEYGSSRAIAGTKGAQGAKGTAEAAENEARNWALSAFDQRQKGVLEVSEPKPFESEHGLTGHTVTATVTDVPKDPDEPCGTFDGKVVTVSYQDLNHDLATWVLVADMGFEGALDDETIELMMNSLRPYPEE